MRVSRSLERIEDNFEILIEGKVVKEVKTFRYLGIVESMIQNGLNRRIIAMRAAYVSYRARVFRNRCLSISAELKLYTVLVKSAAAHCGV